MVSPSTNRMIMKVDRTPVASVSSPAATHLGHGNAGPLSRPGASALRVEAPTVGAPGWSRRKTSRSMVPSGARTKKLQVSRDAPPDRRVIALTPTPTGLARARGAERCTPARHRQLASMDPMLPDAAGRAPIGWRHRPAP